MKQILIIKEPLGKVKSGEDIFKKIQKIKIDYSQENFIVFCLNTQNRLIKAEVLFKGGLSVCIIDPKTIFRFALLKNACRIIIAHNHPSGHLKPSSDDEEIYKKLEKLGDELDLKLLDSIIFNKKEFYSMLDN